jgi:hydrogenase maturation protease
MSSNVRMPARRALVLGIGNLLMGDEGAGIHAVQALQQEPLPAGVDVLDGGTGGFNLLACLSDYPCVILIDATLDGRTPGTVAILRPQFLAEYPRTLSAHDVGLRDLIGTAALLGPLPRLHLVTISIAQVEAATIGLTPSIHQAIPAVLASVRQILRVERIVGFPDTEAHPAEGRPDLT